MPATTCPQCGRKIPIELHEIGTILQCAQCDCIFTIGGGPVVEQPASADGSVGRNEDETLDSESKRRGVPPLAVALIVTTLVVAALLTMAVVATNTNKTTTPKYTESDVGGIIVCVGFIFVLVVGIV